MNISVYGCNVSYTRFLRSPDSFFFRRIAPCVQCSDNIIDVESPIHIIGDYKSGLLSLRILCGIAETTTCRGSLKRPHRRQNATLAPGLFCTRDGYMCLQPWVRQDFFVSCAIGLGKVMGWSAKHYRLIERRSAGNCHEPAWRTGSKETEAEMPLPVDLESFQGSKNPTTVESIWSRDGRHCADCRPVLPQNSTTISVRRLK